MSSKETCSLFIYLVISILCLILSEISAKIYDRCELAHELRYRHNLPIEQVATWTCIAQYQSSFNTAAVSIQADGSGYHGMYQISDMYWCSPPNVGLVCGVECYRLEDDDLTDDLACMGKIFEEHQRIHGDGYNAWTSYQQYCNNGRSQQYVSDCFPNEIIPDYNANTYQTQQPAQQTTTYQTNYNYKSVDNSGVGVGKVYERCELAIDLRYKYNVPKEQIATWICIAKHESNFNTSAIGRLNADGSEDHGLFQISDIYWCSPPGKGWACGLSCSQLENNDISDDVECMKKIYEEHQKISGDGFTAWSVYNLYCRGQNEEWMDGCFPNDEENTINYYPRPAVTASTTSPHQHQQNQYQYYSEQNTKTGYDNYYSSKPPPKIYERCELAHELKNVHYMPPEQLSMWVCIAHHESNFNTSAIGRLNADGSEDHGIFQISDLYWCSPPGKGVGCGLTCSQLEDNNIADDVVCAKKIHEEHTRLSGDGFLAWTVYELHCKGRADKYIEGCFADHPIPKPVYTQPPPTTTIPPKTTKPPPKVTERFDYNAFFSKTFTTAKPTTKKQYFSNNQFDNSVKSTTSKSNFNYNYYQQPTTTKPPNADQYKQPTNKNYQQNYHQNVQSTTSNPNNGFLNYFPSSGQSKSYSTTTQNSLQNNPFFNFFGKNSATKSTTSSPTNNLISSPSGNPYSSNPFLTNYFNQQHTHQPHTQYTDNTHPQQASSYGTSPIQHAVTNNPYFSQSTYNNNHQQHQYHQNTPVTTPAPQNYHQPNYYNDPKTTNSYHQTNNHQQQQYHQNTPVSTPAPQNYHQPNYYNEPKTTNSYQQTNSANTYQQPQTYQTNYQTNLATNQPNVYNHATNYDHGTQYQQTNYNNQQTTNYNNQQHEQTTNFNAQQQYTNYNNPQLQTTNYQQQSTNYNNQQYSNYNNPTTYQNQQTSTYPQDLVTLKPFSFDYINSITTPKPVQHQQQPYSTYYHHSASTKNEVTSKPEIQKTSATKPGTTFGLSIRPSSSRSTTTPNHNQITNKFSSFSTSSSKTLPSSSSTSLSPFAAFTRSKPTTTTIRTTTKSTITSTTTTPKPFTTKQPTTITKNYTVNKSPNSIFSSSYSSPYRSPSLFETYFTKSKTTTTTTTPRTTTKSAFFAALTNNRNPSTYFPTSTTTARPKSIPTIRTTTTTTTTARPTTNRYFDKSSPITTIAPSAQAPMVLTLPHMFNTAPEYSSTVQGLNPDPKLHNTFVDVEPLSGTPIRAGRRVQFNMFISKVEDIGITENIKKALLPIFWIDETVELSDELAGMISNRLVRALFLLDVTVWVMMIGGVILGFGMGYFYYRKQKATASTVHAVSPVVPISFVK